MQRSAAGSYLCWACLSRGLQPKPSLVRRPSSVTAGCSLRKTALRAGRRTLATKRATAVQPPPQQDGVPLTRDRLREWEAEHKSEASFQAILDNAESGALTNVLTRARALSELPLGEEDHSSDLDQPLSDSDGSLDYLLWPSDYHAGDLIEYREDGERLPLLAVCLGSIKGFYHFYLSTGQWIPRTRVKTKFVVRNFVDESLVKPLSDMLPKESLPLQTLRAMSTMKLGPDRACGAELLQKMNKFKQATDLVLQKYAPRLERAHWLVCDAGKRYATLHEIHAQVMGNKNYTQSLTAPAHELYAMHRTIILNDVGFRPMGILGNSATNWLFEITPLEDVHLIQNLQDLVRLFTNVPAKVNVHLSSLTPSQLSQSQIGRFVLKAREAIDESRRFRDWTPHGMLGPSKQDGCRTCTQWSDVDMSIMHFMHIWSGYDQFSESSSLHWIGSAILRATGRYNESEYLTATTGWTFLQEVGYLTPWDIHARYVHRLPDVKVSREGGFAPLPLGPEGIRPYLTQDVFDGKRHDWADLKAFAIDSETTTDVDDAVSIEAADVPGEHWVHIHVADPASRIRPQCALAERPSLTPLTLYLAGHESNIWGIGDELKTLFSLAPNRPCLTFSGKVNEEGELLDYKITPGRLQDVINLTPEDANAAVGSESTSPAPDWSGAIAESFTVGKPSAEASAGRKMTSPAELQAEDLESLKTLYKVANNLHQRRLASGAVPYFPSRSNAQASFHNTHIEHPRPGLMTCSGDPVITIYRGDSESAMVSSTMQLAGEIAARWCAGRNIPIPYLRQQKAEENYDLLKSYADNVYYPVIARDDDPKVNADVAVQFRNLLGPDELSTKPGRNFIMGLKSYAKVTSPLRRYSDLIAHWQIETALAKEMESGQAAHVNTLPFSQKELEKDVLPWLRLRERRIQQLSNKDGTKAYILQAMLRAWKFPEEGAGAASSRLPEKFRFQVWGPPPPGKAKMKRKFATGKLDWFRVDAWMLPERLGQLGISVDDIRRGDVFEVKLADINVHLGEVLVEVTGKVKMQKDQEADKETERAG